MSDEQSQENATKQYHHLEGRVASVETGVGNLWHTLESFQKENKADLSEIKSSIGDLAKRNRLDGSMMLAIAVALYAVVEGASSGAALYVEHAVAPANAVNQSTRDMVALNKEAHKEHAALEGHVGMQTRVSRIESKQESASSRQVARESRDSEMEKINLAADARVIKRLDEIHRHAEAADSQKSSFQAGVLERLRSLEAAK